MISMESSCINSNDKNCLLIEFLTEELPPIGLDNIGKSFANSIIDELKGFVTSDTKCFDFASPRRFGVVIQGFEATEAEKLVLRKGPSISSGFKDGVPTKALQGFLTSCGLTDHNELEQRDDGYFYYSKLVAGKSIQDVIQTIIDKAIKAIPVSKAMFWGENEYQFIRPVHNLLVMFNNQILLANSFGHAANNFTVGHRFLAPKRLEITNANTYFRQLFEEGKVVASFVARKELVLHELHQAATKLNLTINFVPELVEEITGLVEWPRVLIGEFPKEFLGVPAECLILSMAKNQKYFALLDENNKLTNKFLFVTNIESKDPQVVINGNQKVLTARLSDAQFFFNVDKKRSLTDMVTKLESVVYHNKLGSQLDRVKRLQFIANKIAPLLNVNPVIAEETAYLLKADLSSEMVGEFPELQGIIGKYYAKVHNYSDDIAEAIEKHYYPRFGGDALPETDLSIIMALADKLETLVGIWGIGLIPSGDKDPYALRRNALGIIRILLIKDLDLIQLIKIALESFTDLNLNENTQPELIQFIIQRLHNYLVSNAGCNLSIVTAVLYKFQNNKDHLQIKFNYLTSLLKELTEFVGQESSQQLLQSNKRIENILKKNSLTLEEQNSELNSQLLGQPAEKELAQIYSGNFNNGKVLQELVVNQKWKEYFTALNQFSSTLANFFENVMVMDPDKELQLNRLNLLYKLHKVFNMACQLSEIA